MASTEEQAKERQQREQAEQERAKREQARAQEQEQREQERATKRDSGTPTEQPADDAGKADDTDPATTGALGQAAGFASSTQAATGEVVEVPKTPDEIAEQGTELGNTGDFSTGGAVDPVNPEQATSGPQFTRLWGMDDDHTERNRGSFDSLKPDASVQTA